MEQELVIAGFEVIAFVIGVTQMIKQFVEAGGKEMGTQAKMLLALGVGLLFVTPAVLIQEKFLGEQVQAVLVAVLRIVGYLGAILGGYGLVNEKVFNA